MGSSTGGMAAVCALMDGGGWFSIRVQLSSYYHYFLYSAWYKYHNFHCTNLNQHKGKPKLWKHSFLNFMISSMQCSVN